MTRFVFDESREICEIPRLREAHEDVLFCVSPSFFLHLEARALLGPFHRFDFAVVVQVGAEVAVSYDFCTRIVGQQHPDEDA